jgi:hypothetical protein
VLTLTALFALVSACGGGAPYASAPQKPAAGTDIGASGNNADGKGSVNGAGGADEGQDALKDATFFDATYDISVRSLFGIKVCEGEAKIKVGSNFDFKPQGIVKCLFNSITLDLGKMMSGLDQGAAGGQKADSGIDAKDHMIFMKEIAGATFDPPRPLFVSIFSATKSEMRKISYSKNHTATTKDGKRGSGRISLNVVGVDETVYTDKIDQGFRKVLHWKIDAEGFEGVKPAGFIFNSVEFFWNMDPIAIPKIKLQGHIKDFLGQGGLGNLGGGAGGAGGAAGGGGGLGGILGGLGGGGGGGLMSIFKDLAVDIAGDFDIELQLREMEGLEWEN